MFLTTRHVQSLTIHTNRVGSLCLVARKFLLERISCRCQKPVKSRSEHIECRTVFQMHGPHNQDTNYSQDIAYLEVGVSDRLLGSSSAVPTVLKQQRKLAHLSALVQSQVDLQVQAAEPGGQLICSTWDALPAAFAHVHTFRAGAGARVRLQASSLREFALYKHKT